MNGDAPEKDRGEKRKEPESEEDEPGPPGDNSDSEKGKEKGSPKKKKVVYRFFWPSAKEPTQQDPYRTKFTHQVSCTSLSFGSAIKYNPNWL